MNTFKKIPRHALALLLALISMQAGKSQQIDFHSLLNRIVKGNDLHPTLTIICPNKDSFEIYPGEYFFYKLGTYPNKTLPQLLSTATSYGMIDYHIQKAYSWNVDKREKGILDFGWQYTAWSQNQPLVLNSRFLQHAIIYDRNKMRDKTSRLAILIHDPHFSNTAHTHLIQALNEFFKDNPQAKFKFLVEGYYEAGSKNIPLELIDTLLDKGNNRERQVYGLLNNFLIDVPYAFRLLQHPVPAQAIDDTSLILAELRYNDETLTRIRPQDKNYLFDFLFKKTREELVQYPASREQMIRFDTLKRQFDRARTEIAQSTALSNISAFLSLSKEPKFVWQISLLREFNNGNVGFAFAAARDYTMSREINQLLTTPSDTIPIIFIGDFHDYDLTTLLPANTAYLIIEPLGMAIGNSNFYKAVRVDSMAVRRRYIDSIIQSYQLKSSVIPNRSELPLYKQLIEAITNYNGAGQAASQLEQDVFKQVKAELNKLGKNYMISFGGSEKTYLDQPVYFSIHYTTTPEITLYDLEGWRRNPARLKSLASFLEQEMSREFVPYADGEEGRIFIRKYDADTETNYYLDPPDPSNINRNLLLPNVQRQTLNNKNKLKKQTYEA
jgi:hypothetical protein